MNKNYSSQEYIDYLRNDSQAYAKAMQREANVWGRYFTDEDLSIRRKEDQLASKELGIGKNSIGLHQVLKSLELPFNNCLSLACGSGRAERKFIENCYCNNIHGIDISKPAINEAINLSNGMPITYEVQDLNKAILKNNDFDLVITQTCLHHIIELEHLILEIVKCLRPGGYLWVNDYIGETQFQFSDEKLSLVNKILENLSENYRYDSVHLRKLPSKLARRPIGQLASPFEAIRSAEIMPILFKYFDVVKCSESNAIFHLLCPVGTRVEFSKTAEGRILVKNLLELDDLLVKLKILKPCSGMYLLQLKNNVHLNINRNVNDDNVSNQEMINSSYNFKGNIKTNNFKKSCLKKIFNYMKNILRK
jgi:SAM-dependent methyltransferase